MYREEMLENIHALQNPRICNGRLSAQINENPFGITNCSRSLTVTDSEIMRKNQQHPKSNVLFKSRKIQTKRNKTINYWRWAVRPYRCHASRLS